MGHGLTQMDADWAERPPAKMRVGGIFLSGGESRWLGTPKAWLRRGGETLLQHIASVLTQATSPVVLATRHGMKLPPLSAEFRIFCQLNQPAEFEAVRASMGHALSKGPPCEH